MSEWNKHLCAHVVFAMQNHTKHEGSQRGNSQYNLELDIYILKHNDFYNPCHVPYQKTQSPLEPNLSKLPKISLK